MIYSLYRGKHDFFNVTKLDTLTSKINISAKFSMATPKMINLNFISGRMRNYNKYEYICITVLFSSKNSNLEKVVNRSNG
jgi:hypothetical protein